MPNVFAASRPSASPPPALPGPSMSRLQHSLPGVSAPGFGRAAEGGLCRRLHLLTAATLAACALLLSPVHAAESSDTNSPAELLGRALMRLSQLVEPAANTAPRTFTASIRVVKANGWAKTMAGHNLDLALQAPDHLRLGATLDQGNYTFGRDGQDVWVYLPARKFGLIGSPDAPRFADSPNSRDTTPLKRLKFPLPAEQLMLLPLFTDLEGLPNATVGDTPCRVLKMTAKPEAAQSLNLPRGTFHFWLRASDDLPVRLTYVEENGADVQLDLVNPAYSDPWPAEKWKLQPAEGDRITKVARSHLTRSLDVAIGSLGEKVPALGPATGERRVVSREGAGRLEVIDGTRVLFLKGTPEEMGRQHGTLLKKDTRKLVEHIVYGVGVGSSLERGEWVFGEIEQAQKRLSPFMDERYLREVDALATGAGLAREEVRLANYFPELFHCSGFAVFGKATVDGTMYHGRILDYLRGMGLEQSAVVMVLQPDRGNAWVNVGYAGFIGSVTAMNEKHVAIGEMGGKGQGRWDGKPMAELVREVMEKAGTLDEAVEIMRKGPRTCEYYYVISDSKSKRAVGIAATPDKFETLLPGQAYDRLPHAIPDAVLMSAGDRYEELARRVQAGFGKLDATSSRDLMKRPVCMNSNIHCALFAPDTLDFWVANADSQNVAAHTRYTHYNLAELLQPDKAPAPADIGK